MDDPSPEWVVELNGKAARYRSIDQLASVFARFESTVRGRVSLLRDFGEVKGWRRFLGMARDIRPCFALEWEGPYASLIFHDEAWSEYRAIDESRPVQASDDERRHLAHGDVQANPVDECMEKVRAFAAIREYAASRELPKWLKYRYVR